MIDFISISTLFTNPQHHQPHPPGAHLPIACCGLCAICVDVFGFPIGPALSDQGRPGWRDGGRECNFASAIGMGWLASVEPHLALDSVDASARHAPRERANQARNPESQTECSLEVDDAVVHATLAPARFMSQPGAVRSPSGVTVHRKLRTVTSHSFLYRRGGKGGLGQSPESTTPRGFSTSTGHDWANVICALFVVGCNLPVPCFPRKVVGAVCPIFSVSTSPAYLDPGFKLTTSHAQIWQRVRLIGRLKYRLTFSGVKEE